MPPAVEADILPPQASDKVKDALLGLVRDYRSELAGYAKDRDARLNSLEPGAGLFPFMSGCGLPGFGQYGGGPYQDTAAIPSTLIYENSYFPVTLNWILLANSYQSQGLLRKVVNLAVDDAFGKETRLTSALLKPEELDQLNLAFSEKRTRESFDRTAGQAVNYNAGYNLENSDMEACSLTAKWGRLFGGSGLIVNTTQRFDRELNVERIGPNTPLTFIAADRWELVLDSANVNSLDGPVPFNYYGNPLNRSRVCRFVWAEAPSWVRRRLNGWGMSILEDSLRPVQTYLKFDRVLFELLDEAKVDVIGIENFNSSLATRAGTEALVARVMAANQQKNFQSALITDKEDTYVQKSLGSLFAGLAPIRESLRVDLCAYLEIPMNKLFGQSAGGFSSGKDSLDNWNNTVDNTRKTIKPIVKEAGKLRCQQMFGMIPEDLDVEFPPLAILDGVETEAVKTSQQNRITQRYELGLTTDKEALEEMRKAELMDLDETECELGLRDAAPPPSQNPDEAEDAREHEKGMAKTKAAQKKPPAKAKKR